jgi:hypothetical protein
MTERRKPDVFACVGGCVDELAGQNGLNPDDFLERLRNRCDDVDKLLQELGCLGVCGRRDEARLGMEEIDIIPATAVKIRGEGGLEYGGAGVGEDGNIRIGRITRS